MLCYVRNSLKPLFLWLQELVNCLLGVISWRAFQKLEDVILTYITSKLLVGESPVQSSS
jgi:hypothetical protein